MRKLGLLLVVLLLSLAACGSSEPMTFEISGPADQTAGPVTISGEAVDEGMMCSSAQFERMLFRDMDGNDLTDDEVAQLMELYAETGEKVFSAIVDQFTCIDGSGSLVLAQSPLLDESEINFEGVNEVASWEVESGTDELVGLSGDGMVILDFLNGTVTYQGELTES